MNNNNTAPNSFSRLVSRFSGGSGSSTDSASSVQQSPSYIPSAASGSSASSSSASSVSASSMVTSSSVAAPVSVSNTTTKAPEGPGIINNIKIVVNGWWQRLRDPKCGGPTGAVAALLFVGVLVLLLGVHRVAAPGWYVDPMRCDPEEEQRLDHRRKGWHLVILGALITGPAFMAMHSLVAQQQ